ncbi:hypothetical protein BY996DRAFT_6449070 [Phakopsora pachyrhizi]|nr:hypothetical protein BY996DRAFT_6449070 [Phakopsora pachyrhizi]
MNRRSCRNWRDVEGNEKKEERDGRGLGDDCDRESHRDKDKVVEDTEDARNQRVRGDWLAKLKVGRVVMLSYPPLGSTVPEDLNPAEGVGVIVDKKVKCKINQLLIEELVTLYVAGPTMFKMCNTLSLVKGIRTSTIPTGGVAIGHDAWTNHEGVKWTASLPDNPISEDSVHAYIAKSQVVVRVGPQGAQDYEAGVLVIPPHLLGCGISADSDDETNPNYALILNVNCYGPIAYVSVPSQGSSPELPGPFAFEDGLPQWTETSIPLPVVKP